MHRPTRIGNCELGDSPRFRRLRIWSCNILGREGDGAPTSAGEVKAEKPEKSWCRHSGSGEQETGADLGKKWKEQC